MRLKPSWRIVCSVIEQIMDEPPQNTLNKKYKNDTDLLNDIQFTPCSLYTNSDEFANIAKNKWSGIDVSTKLREKYDLIMIKQTNDSVKRVRETTALLNKLNPGGILLYALPTRGFFNATNGRTTHPEIMKYNILNVSQGYGTRGKKIMGKTCLIIQNSPPVKNHKFVVDGCIIRPQ